MSLTPTLSDRGPERGAWVWWLGQAGFAVRFAGGPLVAVDPCLSDAVERLHGFKRLSLPAVTARELPADWVICTHEHTDHLDPDTVAEVARGRPACRFAGPPSCRAGFAEAGVPPLSYSVLAPGLSLDLGRCQAQALQADHGDLSRDALMLVLTGAGVRLAFTGDTAWRPDLFAALAEPRCDLVIPCINGTFGNMNHLDAARAIQQVKPRLAVPGHFWTFAEQGPGDPLGFIHACAAFAPATRVLLLKPGEALHVTPE